jgi:hypothetical protein
VEEISYDEVEGFAIITSIKVLSLYIHLRNLDHFLGLPWVNCLVGFNLDHIPFVVVKSSKVMNNHYVNLNV